MRRASILRFAAAFLALEFALDEWNIGMYRKNIALHTSADFERYLGREGSMQRTDSNAGKSRNRNLSSGEFDRKYELLAGGLCADVDYNRYDFAFFMVGPVLSREICALSCDNFPSDCMGFDVSKSGFCYLYFDNGKMPQHVPGSFFAFPWFGGTGNIHTSNGLSLGTSCFRRRLTPPNDDVQHIDNYNYLGKGYCQDEPGEFYSFLAFFLGGFGTIDACAEKCDGFPLNQGFVWKVKERLCMCQFIQDNLPFDVNDPATLKEIPGSCRFSGGTGSATCEITQSDERSGYECYINKKYPICEPEPLLGGLPIGNRIFEGGVSADPLIMGLQGQTFKFEGRSGAWYSNVATKTLQWNLRFKEFETCPENENMFVTGTTIALYRLSTMPFMKPTIAHKIAVVVEDENNFFPGCQSEVCLGEGSLAIYVDGKKITKPGDYQLGNEGRIIAHNTYSACSRRWFDFQVKDDEDENNRNLHRKAPLDFLIEDQGEMLDPNMCNKWIRSRARDGDLFNQNGGWSTIHIETPTIRYHVEYRQNYDTCESHIVDAWISEIDPTLLEEEWEGILGETRESKFYSNGKHILNERNLILRGQRDKDYEVKTAFGNEFRAQKKKNYYHVVNIGI